MYKTYKIYLNETLIGTSKLEKKDAPMGVVLGELIFAEKKFGYAFIKKYCNDNQIELTYDFSK